MFIKKKKTNGSIILLDAVENNVLVLVPVVSNHLDNKECCSTLFSFEAKAKNYKR